MTTFARGSRVFGQVMSANGSHVVVRLPNGAQRTFISNARPRVGSNVVAFAQGGGASRFEPEGQFFRTGEVDRDRLTFHVANGVTNTFVITRTQTIGNRVVFVGNDQA